MTQSFYNPTPADVQAAKEAQRRGNTGQSDQMLVKSRDIARMVPYWDLVDDIIGGVDAMSAAGETYMPKFVDEDITAYDYRLKNTKMTNIYRDILEGLSTKPFEQEITLPATSEGEGDKKIDTPVPDEVLEFTENVDGAGNNLSVFAASTFFNGINSAIDWIFVDYPPENPDVRTIEDAKKANMRPYWSHVLARNVINVKSVMVGSNEVISFMRILEPGQPDHIREFERLDTGAIAWRLFEKRDAWRDIEGGKTQFFGIAGNMLRIDQIPLVPFITGRRDGRGWCFFPPMADAAIQQKELYQQESALKFVKNLAAYPMLAGNGISPPKDAEGKPQKLAVGPGRVLYGPRDGDGNAGEWTYVEPSATSMKFLAECITDDQQQLRELGRQPLTAQSGNLTVITTAVAANKAKSAVGQWAYMLKDCLENCFVITCKWLNISVDQYDPVVSVYTEFDEFIDGKDLETLDADRDRGDISRETLLEEKKRRGVYGPEFTVERENDRILKEVPSVGLDNNPNDNPPIEDVKP